MPETARNPRTGTLYAWHLRIPLHEASPAPGMLPSGNCQIALPALPAPLRNHQASHRTLALRERPQLPPRALAFQATRDDRQPVEEIVARCRRAIGFGTARGNNYQQNSAGKYFPCLPVTTEGMKNWKWSPVPTCRATLRSLRILKSHLWERRVAPSARRNIFLAPSFPAGAPPAPAGKHPESGLVTHISNIRTKQISTEKLQEPQISLDNASYKLYYVNYKIGLDFMPFWVRRGRTPDYSPLPIYFLSVGFANFCWASS